MAAIPLETSGVCRAIASHASRVSGDGASVSGTVSESMTAAWRPRPPRGQELVDHGGVGGAIREIRGIGGERPHPGHIEGTAVGKHGSPGLDRAGGHFGDHHVRDERVDGVVVGVAELHFERVDAAVGSPRREPVGGLVGRGLERDREDAIAVGVDGEAVERRADRAPERGSEKATRLQRVVEP